MPSREYGASKALTMRMIKSAVSDNNVTHMGNLDDGPRHLHIHEKVFRSRLGKDVQIILEQPSLASSDNMTVSSSVIIHLNVDSLSRSKCLAFKASGLARKN